MNATDLKTHFYKRFSGVSGRLAYERAGFPVSLLGYMSDHADCIGAGLSMHVCVMARKTGARDVTVTSTASDLCRRYPVCGGGKKDETAAILSRMSGYKLNGGEMLVDSTIPPLLSSALSYRAAFLKAVLEISDISMPSCEVMASILSEENEKNPYLVLFTAESGYCAAVKKGGVRKLPLPMSGYKLMLVSAVGEEAEISPNAIADAYRKVRTVYPHITHISELTEDMLNFAAPKIKSRQTEYLLRHLIGENERIAKGERVLLGCDIKSFAEVMSESFYSQKQILKDSDIMAYLGDITLNTDGVIGARLCKSGVIAIVDIEACGWAANMIKTKASREFSHPPVICVADTV